MRRPKHIPDFTNPPLHEVVLGTQFAPAKNYQQIRAFEVWELYRKSFPLVEEHPPLPPSFETFGLPHPQSINVNFVSGAQHDRFWFLSSKKDELIQFQNDRLLHNWRKVGDKTNEYPRFENMIARFEHELRQLDGYFATLANQKLNITQCEITYINHIKLGDAKDITTANNVFRFLQFPGEKPDDLFFSFRRTICSETGSPIGRLIADVQSAVDGQSGGKMYILSITARGLPQTPDIAGTLGFLKLGREMVVQTFAEVTTDSMHKSWGRVQ